SLPPCCPTLADLSGWLTPMEVSSRSLLRRRTRRMRHSHCLQQLHHLSCPPVRCDLSRLLCLRTSCLCHRWNSFEQDSTPFILRLLPQRTRSLSCKKSRDHNLSTLSLTHALAHLRCWGHRQADAHACSMLCDSDAVVRANRASL